MPNIKVMSWNIQIYGTAKQGKSTFLPRLIAETLLQQNVDILVILELQNNANQTILQSIVNLANVLTGVAWGSKFIDVGDESVGFLWRPNNFQPVATQFGGGIVADTVCVGRNIEPLYFPQTTTSWNGLANRKPNGRRPAFMLFQTAAPSNTPFLVAGIHTPFDAKSLIQAYSTHQYGMAYQTEQVWLNNVMQTYATLENSIGVVTTQVQLLLAGAGIGNDPKQVRTLVQKTIVDALNRNELYEKLITYEGDLFEALMECVLSTISLVPWPGFNLVQARLMLLQAVATIGAILFELWPMGKGNAAQLLQKFIAVNFGAYVLNANAKLGWNAWLMFMASAVDNPFSDVETDVGVVQIKYAVLAGDFNVDSPDLSTYDASEKALLTVPGAVAPITAYTCLLTALDANTQRDVAFNNTKTTSVSAFDSPFKYSFNVAAYNVLLGNPAYATLCQALNSISGQVYCSNSAASAGVLGALLAFHMKASDMEKYAAQIDSVFPASTVVSQTPQMRVNAYDNFGIQYPATAMNPLVNQSAPDILSSLGSWVASAGPCIWPAATGGPLNAVAVSFLTTYPQTVGTHILAPNLPDVIDASMFYRRLISDHFPIVAQFSLP